MSIKPLIFNRRNAEEARDLLSSLVSPNRLPVSAIENAVTSVNGQTGDIVVEMPEDMQPLSQILTDLSEMKITEDGMLWNESGNFTVAPVSSFVRGMFSAPNDEYLRGMMGLGDSSVLDVNVPYGVATLDASGKVPSGMIDINLATVATSGSYNDLSEKPSLFSGVYADLSGKPTLFDGSYSSLTNVPEFFSGSYLDLSNKPNLFSGNYDDLTNKPVLFNGDYNSLTNKPTIPVVNYPVTSVNSKTGAVVLSNTDVGAAAMLHPHEIADITGLQTALNGKISTGSTIPYSTLSGVPALSVVATSGSYTDLLNKPTLFSGNYADLTNKPPLFDGTYASLNGKPTLATVATSGSYVDLSNKPTIPAAQVSSDWAAISGVSQILNKPTLFDGTWTSLTGKPTFATVATSGSYADLTNRPAIPAAQVQPDWNATTGLGVILNKPTIPATTTQIAEGTNLYHTDARVQSYLTAQNYRKVETLQGVTNASGVYQVTFANSYAVAPHVNPFIVNGTPAQIVTVSNVTTTGCTVTVSQRNSVTLLNIEVLLAATVPVANATVGVLVVAKA